MNRKLFVIDFTAILPYGHNASGVKYFSDFYGTEFHEIYPVVCKALPDTVDFIDQDARQAPYLYTRNMIKSIIPASKSIFNWSTESSVNLRFFRKYIHKMCGVDCFELIAVRFFKRLLKEHAVNKDDAFFFHSASYYEVCGLLGALNKRRLEDWPKIHFRFINVMENANINSNGYRNITRMLHRHFKRQTNENIRKVSISSEVPSYTERLMRDTGGSAIITPYPPMPLPTENNRDDLFTVAALGAGREDKGFFRLKNIIDTFFQNYPQARARFILQSVDQSSIIDNYEQSHYISQLLATPNVEILQHTMTSEDMDYQFSRANLVILPYDPVIYANRGSAILMEAIGKKVPVLATKGCGFSEYINLFDNGALCASNEDFADQIYKVMTTDRKKLADKCDAAREKHLEYFNNYYSKVWA